MPRLSNRFVTFLLLIPFPIAVPCLESSRHGTVFLWVFSLFFLFLHGPLGVGEDFVGYCWGTMS
jgi:hypothetical protein